MGKTRLNKDVGIVWGLMGGSVLLIAAAMLPGLMTTYRPSVERKPDTSLKTIIAAQEEFRLKDLDGDGVRQFWRADVAGLYTLRPRSDPAKPILKLIELSVACADDRPQNNDLEQYAVRAPKAGYWFRAIRHADEKSPSPDRYAVIAIPSTYPEPARYTLVVDERRDIYRMDLGHGRGLEVFPTPAELKTKWSKLD
jgi:hypothetical protein